MNKIIHSFVSCVKCIGAMANTTLNVPITLLSIVIGLFVSLLVGGLILGGGLALFASMLVWLISSLGGIQYEYANTLGPWGLVITVAVMFRVVYMLRSRKQHSEPLI